MGSEGRVIVVGSANVDHVIDVERLPLPGETVIGRRLTVTGGGKGANQAVAAARDGARVVFVGSVGSDPAGTSMLRDLRAEGIEEGAVQRRKGEATGAAFITVDGKGQNTIVVASGANASLGATTTVQALDALKVQPADVCLLSFELPIDTVVAVATRVHARGGTVVVNPAPARPLPDTLLRTRPVLTPNELEAIALTGLSDHAQAARDLVARTGTWVAVTLGGDGVLLADGDELRHVPGWSTLVMDTTGAGDTFSGVLSAALARGEKPEAAVTRANAAAALSVGAMGARAGMPRHAAIDALLAREHAGRVSRGRASEGSGPHAAGLV